MGNGGGVRYQKKEKVEEGADSWRKLKEPKVKGKENDKDKSTASNIDSRIPSKQKSYDDTSAPPGMTPSSYIASSQAALAAEKAAASWRAPTMHEGSKMPAPVASAFEDDEDDLTGFENLADAANKVWDDLMKQKHTSKTDFNALLHLGDLKDGVERAMKRSETLNRIASEAASKADEKLSLLEDHCTRIEAKGGKSADSHSWKLGDIAIRRGKGLCELSMVHHEADPPYFEVRMATTGSVVGTESTKLIALSGPDQGAVRRVLRGYEEAKTAKTRSEEEANQASDELKQQHDALTSAMEQALKTKKTAEPAGSPSKQNLPGPKLAPPGFPDLKEVRKFSHAPKEIIPDLPEPRAPSSYPDMKGVKEDLRGGSYPDMKGVKEDLRGGSYPDMKGVKEDFRSGARSDTVHSQASHNAGGSGNLSGSGSFHPSGFPSFDDMKKSQQQEQQERRPQAAANDYPSVHPGAKRETFSRPEATGTSSSSTWQDSATRNPSESFNSSFKGSSMPDGFPSFDTGTKQPTQRDNAYRGPPESSGDAPPKPSLGKRVAGDTSNAEKTRKSEAAQKRAQYEQQQAWQRAQEQAQQEAKGQSAPSSSAPSGDVWTVYISPEGSPYYHNPRTNETVWHLPPGAKARNPDGSPAAGPWQQTEQFADDDPFADLRKQDEQMRQQREYWSQWYAQYSAWYAQQSGQQGQEGSAPSSEPQSFGERSGARKAAKPKEQASSSGPGHSAGSASNSKPDTGYNPFYEESKQKSQAKPTVSVSRGPPPPRLLAGVEDHTIYAIKSAILKEMEQMVDKAKPINQRKKALRVLQMRWHPDKNPDKIDASKSVFQFIEDTKPWFLFDPDAHDA